MNLYKKLFLFFQKSDIMQLQKIVIKLPEKNSRKKRVHNFKKIDQTKEIFSFTDQKNQISTDIFI